MAGVLEQFANQHHLKIRRDSCGDDIIPGKAHKALGVKRPEDNPHIYGVEGKTYLVAYETFVTQAKWTFCRQKLMDLGGDVICNCQMEGLIVFDPNNKPLVDKILRYARIHAKRQLSEEQKQKIRDRFARMKQQ